MFELKFKIKRIGTWSNQLGRFKTHISSHTTFSKGNGKTSDIVHIVADNPKSFKNILKVIRSHKITRKVEILFKDETNMYLQVFSNVSQVGSVIGTINKYGGFIVKPVLFEKDYEIWRVFLPSKENLDKITNTISRFGDFHILSIRKAHISKGSLSVQQKKVMDLAVKLGYYNFPRNISATSIAKQLGLSKATILQHLRTAEKKFIIDNYLS